MNTENNEWIKMSERKPTTEDFSGCAVEYANPAIRGRTIHYIQLHADGHTHWRKIPLPDLPPKELTQREKDEEANQRIHDAWYSATTRASLLEFAQRIRADERREILAMLDAAAKANGCGNWAEGSERFAWHKEYRTIRARLETQGE